MQSFSPEKFPLLRRGIAALAVVALGSALPSCSRQGEDEEDELMTKNSFSSTGSCGVERWAVKTGTDSAAAQVNFTPQSTTIAALGAKPVPSGLTTSAPRLQPDEFQTFKLTNVTLTQYKLESDSDYHLVLTDGTATMIAEIPDPACVSGGPFASGISASRSAFDARYTATTSFQTANVPVTVTGAGFFDIPHGQTGASPNNIELHAVLSICFGTNCSGTSTPDFSLSANPTSVSAAPGASATTSITATGTGGFSGTVSLSASGVPAGATATFSPTSIASGGSSTLTLAAGASTAPGTYTVTVTGTSGTLSHTTSVAFTVTSSSGGSGITNGGFETGSLSGWTATGTASVVTGGHGGTYAAQVGSTAATNGDSSIAQTFTAPSGTTGLSFYYKVVCPDSVTYDWATATLRDNTAATTATVLAKTCTNSGAWVQATASITAGHSYTLTLTSHDDNYAGDATYTLYDDVTLTGTAPPPPDFTIAASPTSLSGSGTSTITTTAVNGFGGTVSLSAGGVPTGATASFSPTSIAGAGSSTLTLTAGTAAAGSYTVTVTGTSGTLTHSTSIAWTIAGASGGGVTNGGFETGTFSGWTTSGTTSITTTSHSGTYAAVAGSTAATNGDSSIVQTFTAPTGKTQVSLWYANNCPDTVTYDWMTVSILDNTTGVTRTMVPHTCAATYTWTNSTIAIIAGHSYTLTMTNHDDNYSGDPTYTLFDDVTLN